MRAPEKRDNYQTTLVRTRELFLKYDQQAIIDRFSLNADERYLYLTFVARPYRIERATGAIEFLKDWWRPAGHGDGMTIYDILCDAKPGARISGRFQNAWNQRNVSSAPNGSLFQDSADYFSGKCALLSAACERLGGERAGTGDVGFDIPVLGEIKMRILFWDADDEFPASMNLQWDEHILDFMRYETTFYAAGFVMNRLREEAADERGMAKAD